MSKPIIEIENLGKCYQIGANREKYLSLRDELSRTAHGFFRRFLARHHQVPKKEEFWALKDVSFSVQEGEAVGIIGRNGAGKSTLLKILSKITPPTTGKITLRGRMASLLEVGTGFHPELTGRENIYLNGAILGMTRAEIKCKFDEIVAFAEIEKFLDTPVKRYSSGMYVRLAFAVAAHLEPEILVVDEVLAVGDAEFQKKCLGKMDDVAKQGRTVLFVSHNMATLKVLCRTAILLKEGKVIDKNEVDRCIAGYMGGQNQGESILSHVATCDSRIKLNYVKVNGSESDVVELPPTCDKLEIVVQGVLLKPTRLDLEARIHDIQGIPLGLFSPAHERGGAKTICSGQFQLSYTVKLPRMTKGHYVINLFITDPGVAGWVIIPSAVTLYVEATATPSGIVFEYQRNNGWIWLGEDKTI